MRGGTEPPFTVSIEGEWGSGKTTFMGLLMKSLKNAGAEVVWFKPWRHDKEESVWGAFAMTFVTGLSRTQPWWRRPLTAWKVIRRRRVLGPVWSLFLFVLALALGIGLYSWLWGNGALRVADLLDVKRGNERAIARIASWARVGGVIPIMVILCFALRYAKRLVGNPLTPELRRYFKVADYADRVTFIERFHQDFQKVVEAYAGDKRVFVFIDDLDRCEVPRAADLMQALNLMLDEGTELFFILGMDREKVAAGLAAKHKDVLPYLRVPGSGERDTRDHEQQMREVGLDYGHAFIEKFIQLPLRVPPATGVNLDKFLDGLGKQEEKTRRRNSLWQLIAGRRARRGQREDAGLSTTEGPAEAEGREESAKPSGPAMADADGPEVRELVRLVAPALAGNPRRIIHFTNLLRIWLYIGNRTELLAGHGEREPIVTQQQLAKFLAISIRWPRLMLEIAQRPQLLRDMALIAEQGDASPGRQEPQHIWLGCVRK